MTQSVEDKVKFYVEELHFLGLLAMTGEPWPEVKEAYIYCYNKLESESEEVRSKVALAQIEAAEKAIELQGQTSKSQYKFGLKLAERKLPSDLSIVKRGIEFIEKNAGDKIPPRIAFHYSAIKNLPDDHPENVKKMAKSMREVSKKRLFKKKW